MGNLARYHVENLPELMKVIRQNGIGMDDYLDRFFHTPTHPIQHPEFGQSPGLTPNLR